ncbi:hypothetical protein E4T92_08835 [Pasteurella sp. WM03]|uniref:hypothetical protein n=1 Tax=Pasteurella sp. WM03 TaxID=2558280 RepID=UPI001073BBF6|nr:hypothetical protein [Pasteurella sp. 19428wF3_WM03]TFU50466.1 hypothetical protein E4T92_08835 [Pasteurella sp. WM03]
MQNLAGLFEATRKIQEREKQAPSQNTKIMLAKTLENLDSELDDKDYFYLSLFAEALIESKKLSKANDFPFEHLGLFAHSLRECSSSVS